MIMQWIKKLFNKNQKVTALSYPNKYGDKTTRITNISGSAVNVANTKIAILTITPNGVTPYTTKGLYISNIIGNACVVDLYVETTSGEGALAGNKRDTKVYTGAETYGGYIANFSSYTTSYIYVTNSSGGDLTFIFNGVVEGDVSYTITKTV